MMTLGDRFTGELGQLAGSVRWRRRVWEVSPAAYWPNVAWLTCPRGRVVLVYERRDGLLGVAGPVRCVGHSAAELHDELVGLLWPNR